MQNASSQAVEALKREITRETAEIASKKTEHTRLLNQAKTVEAELQHLEHQQSEKKREIDEMQKELMDAMKKK